MPRRRLSDEERVVSNERRKRLRRIRVVRQRDERDRETRSILEAADAADVLTHELWDAVVTRWGDASAAEREELRNGCRADGHHRALTPMQNGATVCTRCCDYRGGS